MEIVIQDVEFGIEIIGLPDVKYIDLNPIRINRLDSDFSKSVYKTLIWDSQRNFRQEEKIDGFIKTITTSYDEDFLKYSLSYNVIVEGVFKNKIKISNLPFKQYFAIPTINIDYVRRYEDRGVTYIVKTSSLGDTFEKYYETARDITNAYGKYTYKDPEGWLQYFSGILKQKKYIDIPSNDGIFPEYTEILFSSPNFTISVDDMNIKGYFQNYFSELDFIKTIEFSDGRTFETKSITLKKVTYKLELYEIQGLFTEQHVNVDKIDLRYEWPDTNVNFRIKIGNRLYYVTDFYYKDLKQNDYMEKIYYITAKKNGKLVPVYKKRPD